MERFDLGVIGGGTAGLVTSAVSAGIGASTVLIERDRLGGECLWTGCVPSKAILRAASVAATVRGAGRFGVRVGGAGAAAAGGSGSGSGDLDARASVDFQGVMEHVRGAWRAIEPHDSPERFRSLGVDVVAGTARFLDSTTVDVDGRRIVAKRWVVATGSRTAVPPIEGLEASGYLTHETIWELDALPPSLAVLGAGPIGVELAQTFARLGSRVTLVEAAPEILPREDAEIAAVLRSALEADGVDVRTSSEVVEVGRRDGMAMLRLREAGGRRPEAGPDAPDGGRGPERIEAAAVLVATGRRANVEELGLEAIGVEADRAGIRTDRRLRTAVDSVWAAGDVVGPYRFTHVADYHARLVAPNALFPIRRKLDYRVVPWCTFTDPEVARVGLSEAQARDRWGESTIVVRYDHGALDRAICDGEIRGLTKLVADPKGRLVGAHIASARAGESIHEAVLALRNRMRLSALSSTIHVYPTYPESLRRSGDVYVRERFARGLPRRVADLAVRLFV